MTSIFHRRFHPDDVDGTIAYVAPVLYADDMVESPNNRFIQFLQKVGPDPQCRENLKTFQRQAGLSADQLFELMNWTSTSTRDLDVLGQLAGASFDENWSREDWLAYLRQAVKMPGFSDTGMPGRVLQYLENPPVRDY